MENLDLVIGFGAFLISLIAAIISFLSYKNSKSANQKADEFNKLLLKPLWTYSVITGRNIEIRLLNRGNWPMVIKKIYYMKWKNSIDFNYKDFYNDITNWKDAFSHYMDNDYSEELLVNDFPLSNDINESFIIYWLKFTSKKDMEFVRDMLIKKYESFYIDYTDIFNWNIETIKISLKNL